FSIWYLHLDPYINQFFKYLLLFLISMLILVTTNNLFQLFIGYQVRHIHSMVSVQHKHMRPATNFYTRPNFLKPPPYRTCTSHSQKISSIWTSPLTPGPTPESALLHSSTTVVAGVFLLIPFYPLTENKKLIQTIALCLGALTTLFTAIWALTQNDIKKIIAFSTSSQLGLIMVTIGINQPYLAFLHICTHAFFKAILFICSGSIIHSLNNEQDIQKIGGLPIQGFTLHHNIPCYLASSIDRNAFPHRTHIILFALLGQPRFSPPNPINENNPLLINSIKRLLIGNVFSEIFPHHQAPSTSLPKPINKPKISILPFRLNLTRKYSTKNHNPYSTKTLHTNLKPKRPYQAILPIIPHYSYP
ncbi:hypothetical protein E2I00_018684, partial [Balaenoptera physalus]